MYKLILYFDDKLSIFIFLCTYLLLEYHTTHLVIHYNLKYIYSLFAKPAIAISRAMCLADQHRGRCTSRCLSFFIHLTDRVLSRYGRIAASRSSHPASYLVEFIIQSPFLHTMNALIRKLYRNNVSLLFQRCPGIVSRP